MISRQWGGNSQVVLMPGPHDFALGGSGLLHGIPIQFAIVLECHLSTSDLVSVAFSLLLLPLTT